MTAYLHLNNPIRHYGWGSHTAIAYLQGRDSSDRPEAELWIGAHPSAPSTVRTMNSAAPVALHTLIQSDATGWLGDSAGRFGNQFPFLLKILAAAQPLSLQVHPTKKRAAAVFPDQTRSIYVDANHKPEVLCALTEFTALQGFRRFSEAGHLLAQLSGIAPNTSQAIELFTVSPNAERMRQLLVHLVTLDVAEASALAEAVHSSCSSLPGQEPGSSSIAAAVRLLYKYYPHDALVLAPLLLKVVVLQPGEALYTGAGTLHSYLQGTGIELMSTSDNVLRAGLTPKEINVEELLHVTRFEELITTKLLATKCPPSSFLHFPTPAKEFELSVLNFDHSDKANEPEPREVQILLCTSGTFSIAGATGHTHTDRESLSSGEALLVRAYSGPYELQGQGQLFRATVPRQEG